MQRLEVSGAVRLIYRSLGVKGLSLNLRQFSPHPNKDMCRHDIVTVLCSMLKQQDVEDLNVWHRSGARVGHRQRDAQVTRKIGLHTGCVHEVTRGTAWGRGYVPRKGDRREAHRVLDGRPEEKSHLEDLGVDGRKILKMDLQDVDWSGSGYGQVAALVNAVMNIWLHKMRGISWLSENWLASGDGLCCVELVGT